MWLPIKYKEIRSLVKKSRNKKSWDKKSWDKKSMEKKSEKISVIYTQKILTLFP